VLFDPDQGEGKSLKFGCVIAAAVQIDKPKFTGTEAVT
jgi:hypothetical protein